MSWIQTFFCAHHFQWVRNIYGDEINTFGGKRSLWRCVKCGKATAQPSLFHDHEQIQPPNKVPKPPKGTT